MKEECIAGKKLKWAKTPKPKIYHTKYSLLDTRGNSGKTVTQ
jgi:hypothetical protein